MIGYNHLKYPRMKCTNASEEEQIQKERAATNKEFEKHNPNFNPTRKCVKCGKTFLGACNDKGRTKYCSYRCRNDAQIERRRHRHLVERKKHCVTCNEFFVAKRDDAVFCSNACRQKWYRDIKKHSGKTVTDLGLGIFPKLKTVTR